MGWAEEFGVGELGLSPEVFWSLTVREFWIKHAAFARAESRTRALVFELVLMSGHVKDKARGDHERAINRLRRYPIKSWLRPK